MIAVVVSHGGSNDGVPLHTTFHSLDVGKPKIERSE